MENNVVEINEKEYVVVTTINKDNKVYLVLAPYDNPEDIMLREYVKEDGKEYFKMLDSEEEFYEVITNYKKDGGEINE